MPSNVTLNSECSEYFVNYVTVAVFVFIYERNKKVTQVETSTFNDALRDPSEVTAEGNMPTTGKGTS